jgi:chromosome partitioning protein
MVKKVNPESLVGVAEIAAHANVSTQAVVNWAKRHPKFPKPVRVLRSGPIFLSDEVAKWMEATGRA